MKIIPIKIFFPLLLFAPSLLRGSADSGKVIEAIQSKDFLDAGKMILGGIDPSYRDASQRSVLHWLVLAHRGFFLLTPDTDTPETDAGKGISPVDLAAIVIYQQLKISSESARAFVNAVDKEGNTALHYVVTISDGKVGINQSGVTLANILLAAGGDPTLKNGQGKTALEIASDPRNKSMIDFKSWLALKQIKKAINDKQPF